jgi:branched-chain amino acid transport system ATP-binding protein
VEKLTEALQEINRRGLTILLVEQDVMTAFDLASHGVVVETGRVTLTGPTAELALQPRVREAYLGI